jgi:hypothetical protein
MDCSNPVQIQLFKFCSSFVHELVQIHLFNTRELEICSNSIQKIEFNPLVTFDSQISLTCYIRVYFLFSYTCTVCTCVLYFLFPDRHSRTMIEINELISLL